MHGLEDYMHRWFHRSPPLLGAALLLLVISCGFPLRIAADAGDEEAGVDWSNWTPSITLGLGIVSQDLSTKIFGGFAQLKDVGTFDPDIFGTPGEVFCRARIKTAQANGCIFDFTADTGSSLADPAIPFGVTFLSPAIRDFPGKPRAFFQAGYGFPQGGDTELATVNSAPRLNRTGTSLLPLEAKDVNVFVFSKPVGFWWAGVGTSFSVPMGEYDVEIKPSINYLGETIKSEVIVEEHIPRLGDPAEALPDPVTGIIGQTFYHTSNVSKDVYHGIAPGLGLNIELGRRGPVAIGLYADSLFGIFFEERTASFSSVSKPIPAHPTAVGREFDVPGRGEVRLRFDRYTIVAHAGLRFSWVGDR